jgi:hypothetical protein
LSLKNASLLTENRQLSAENQVLDKALKWIFPFLRNDFFY